MLDGTTANENETRRSAELAERGRASPLSASEPRPLPRVSWVDPWIVGRLLALYLHAPHRVPSIIGNKQGALRQQRQSDRPPVRLSCLHTRHEAGQEILRRAGGLAVTERHKHHFIA